MSGFWNIGEIESWEDLWVDLKPESCPGLVPSRKLSDGRTQWLDPVTAVLLWTLPCIEVDEISAGNLDEVFQRTRMLELARGPLLTHGNKHAFLTLADLRRRIGLRVGAGMALRPFEEILLESLKSRAREALNDAKDTA